MKKILCFLINILPVLVGYSVFAILLAIFANIPGIGRQIANLWYIPFGIISIYMFYTGLKDFRARYNN